jgi:AraC-like DNA-binding protein
MTCETQDPVQLSQGDIAIVRGNFPYVVADHPDTEPQVIIHPGQRCTTPDGFDVDDGMNREKGPTLRTHTFATRSSLNKGPTLRTHTFATRSSLNKGPTLRTHTFATRSSLGTRSWGNDVSSHDPNSTIMLTGTYQFEDELSQRLLTALPQSLFVRADEADQRLVSLLADEMGKERPGQQALLDRLLDLLLISSLRVSFDHPDGPAPAWYRAHADPIVGPAIRLMEQHPEHPWTLATLAAEANCSRALLGRQFTLLLGEPPMRYLTEWRLSMAADLLDDPALTLGAIAQRVGYGTPFALSAAFKRSRGLSPQEFRKR